MTTLRTFRGEMPLRTVTFEESFIRGSELSNKRLKNLTISWTLSSKFLEVKKTVPMLLKRSDRSSLSHSWYSILMKTTRVCSEMTDSSEIHKRWANMSRSLSITTYLASKKHVVILWPKNLNIPVGNEVAVSNCRINRSKQHKAPAMTTTPARAFYDKSWD